MIAHHTAALLRADGEFYYRRPLAMLLALVLLLVWQGVAQARELAALDTTQLPDAVHGPGADRIPPGLACTDNMDFSPDDNALDPADADSVAWRPQQDKASALPAAADEHCLRASPRVSNA